MWHVDFKWYDFLCTVHLKLVYLCLMKFGVLAFLCNFFKFSVCFLALSTFWTVEYIFGICNFTNLLTHKLCPYQYIASWDMCVLECSIQLKSLLLIKTVAFPTGKSKWQAGGKTKRVTQGTQKTAKQVSAHFLLWHKIYNIKMFCDITDTLLAE